MSESVTTALDRILYLARQMEQTDDSRTLLALSRELRRAVTDLVQRIRRERAARTADRPEGER